MTIRPIRTDEDYRAALREVSPCFDNEPDPDSPEGERFEILLTSIEAYEAKRLPMDLPPGELHNQSISDFNNP